MFEFSLIVVVHEPIERVVHVGALRNLRFLFYQRVRITDGRFRNFFSESIQSFLSVFCERVLVIARGAFPRSSISHLLFDTRLLVSCSGIRVFYTWCVVTDGISAVKSFSSCSMLAPEHFLSLFLSKVSLNVLIWVIFYFSKSWHVRPPYMISPSPTPLPSPSPLSPASGLSSSNFSTASFAISSMLSRIFGRACFTS